MTKKNNRLGNNPLSWIRQTTNEPSSDSPQPQAKTPKKRAASSKKAKKETTTKAVTESDDANKVKEVKEADDGVDALESEQSLATAGTMKPEEKQAEEQTESESLKQQVILTGSSSETEVEVVLEEGQEPTQADAVVTTEADEAAPQQKQQASIAATPEREESPIPTTQSTIEHACFLFALSAKNEAALKTKLADVHTWLEKSGDQHRPGDISYTMLVGRSHFSVRITFVAQTIGELKAKVALLNQPEHLATELEKRKTLIAQPKNAYEELDNLLHTIQRPEAAHLAEYSNQLTALATFYLSGYDIDWKSLYLHTDYHRISMPTYPFAKDRYWIPEPATKPAAPNSPQAHSQNGTTQITPGETAKLHPLVHTNTSTVREQKFTSRLKGQEPFFTKGQGADTLAGLTYLEMAYAAAMLAEEGTVHSLTDLRWAQPIEWDEAQQPQEIQLSLYPEHDGLVFQISTAKPQEKRTIHAQGQIRYVTDSEQLTPEHIELGTIHARLASGMGSGTSGHAAVAEILTDGAELLARLSLPEELADSNGIRAVAQTEEQAFTLHPVLLEAVQQVAGGFIHSEKNAGGFEAHANQRIIPIAMKQAEIYRALPRECYAYMTKSKNGVGGTNSNPLVGRTDATCDITLTDEKGIVVARFQGLTLWEVQPAYIGSSHTNPDLQGSNRTARGDQNSLVPSITGGSNQPELMYFTSEWVRTPFTESETAEPPKSAVTTRRTAFSGPIVLFDTDDTLFLSIQTALQSNADSQTQPIQAILVKPGTAFAQLDSHTYEIDPENKEDYIWLLQHLAGRNLLPERILHRWQSYDPAASQGGPNGLTAQQALDSYVQTSLGKGVHPLFHLIHAIHETKTRSLRRLLVVYSEKAQIPNPFLEAVSGYAKSLGFVLPTLALSMVQVSDDPATQEQLNQALIEELANHAVTYPSEIRYENGERYIRQYKEATPASLSGIAPKQHGVYLITGGAGALGLLFARYLAKNYQAKLVLTGRSELTDAKRKAIQELNIFGSDVLYLQANADSLDEMQQVILTTREKFGPINGVIHAAGNVGDLRITEKEWSTFAATLKPKVHGTVILDQLTKTEPLDFFVMFSSTSAVLGDFGQCDYAVGNRFLDAYARFREQLRENRTRLGQTISINWPLWREGGMGGGSDAEEEQYLQTSGMAYLETESGLAAFEQILAGGVSRVVIMVGIPNRLRRVLGIEPVMGQAQPQEPAKTKVKKLVKRTVTTTQAERTAPEHLVETEVRTQAASLLKMNPDDMDITENLGNYGFDSINLKELAILIGDTYGFELSPTVFFAHSSIQAIRQYLLDEFSAELTAFYQKEGGEQTVEEWVEVEVEEEASTEGASEKSPEGATEDSNQNNRYSDIPVIAPYKLLDPRYRTASQSSQSGEGTSSTVRRQTKEPVAIIGISGVFPGSADLNHFWHNLQAEKDLISEIPSDRWDHTQYGDHSALRYGGFITDVDKFDPLFFNISPKEAELMDPQQRLYLENVWKTIENAGYKASQFSGQSVGVFTGVQFSDYRERLSHLRHQQIATGNEIALISNRVSYLLNLRGPSEVVDTACSSSSVAIHRAVKAIQNGECELAIAGGVSLLLSPHTYQTVGELGVLSPDGKCKTFDSRANGYVRGEGVGVLLIKPLSQAIADRDHIYAVIQGTAVNHGGKANSLTAPNSDAQAALLVKAYEDAGLSPSTVSYIEAHGTGTELGDPVEIDGLKKAFNELSRQDPQAANRHGYCGLGSVKTNIGHLEPASGIAGLMKIILSMQHGVLPRTLHFDKMNPYIDLKNSPFYIVDEQKTWDRLTDVAGNEIPRRAGISSFGFGGSNAHIIVEEYTGAGHGAVSDSSEAPQGNTNAPQANNVPHLFIFSAKDRARLMEQAQNFRAFLDQSDTRTSHSLTNIAYTLQVGREEMEERLAIVASTPQELSEKLGLFAQGKTKGQAIYTGNSKQDAEKWEHLFSGAEGEEFISVIIHERKLTKLAQLWVSGMTIRWERLYTGPNEGVLPYRTSLPTYPFARESYWIDLDAGALAGVGGQGEAKLHPLVGRNTSTFTTQRFSSTFTGNEFFLRDHVVNGQKVLPGVAYLEMARIATELAAEQSVGHIRNVMWSKPIMLTDDSVGTAPGQPGAEVHLHLYPDGDAADFEVFTLDEQDNITVHGQGKVSFEQIESNLPSWIDLDDIRERCTTVKSKHECYQDLTVVGFGYGPAFQPIEELRANDTEALSLIQLPASVRTDFDRFLLHPSLMDGALQTVAGLIGPTAGALYIPMALGALTWNGELPQTCYAYATFAREPHSTNSGMMSFHVQLVDESGHVLVTMRDFSVKEVKESLNNRNGLIDLFQRLKNGELDIHEVEQLMEGATL
ncbi:SDR family NAD(P)-dependent oxidoreductase [Brevibacillus dissolubilis]|uniref:SDR family NAD(P)-dependent oxidoreductase n=1 Tax=Brevibacillus dissolubilis TaxID=1844116 RepID=UPI0011165E5C|nr:SDR family NAD(P)-dependent oxidoreductase [Brevibacillus dissolubilis]